MGTAIRLRCLIITGLIWSLEAREGTEGNLGNLFNGKWMEGGPAGGARGHGIVEGPAGAREEPERRVQGRDYSSRGDRGAAGPAAASFAEAVGV